MIDYRDDPCFSARMQRARAAVESFLDDDAEWHLACLRFAEQRWREGAEAVAYCVICSVEAVVHAARMAAGPRD